MSEKKSRGSFPGFFLSMQIADLLLDGLDLFLHHRHAFGKIVVFPHFSYLSFCGNLNPPPLFFCCIQPVFYCANRLFLL